MIRSTKQKKQPTKLAIQVSPAETVDTHKSKRFQELDAEYVRQADDLKKIVTQMQTSFLNIHQPTTLERTK